MKIAFATADWSTTVNAPDGSPAIGGAGYYRMKLPSAWCERFGKGEVETYIGRLVAETAQGREALGVHPWGEEALPVMDCDIVVLQRWMHEGLDHHIRMARANGQTVVNDLDDWFFGLDKRNRATMTTDPRSNPNINRDHYRRNLAAGDAVTVSTPFLADRMREMFPKMKVVVLRNMIDLDRWEAKDESTVGGGVGDPISIGWVGAKAFRSGDIESLDGVVGDVCTKTGAHFHHAGYLDLPPDFADRVRDGKISSEDLTRMMHWHEPVGVTLGCPTWTHEGMAPIEQYPWLFASIDIGIVPLNDVPFNEAKSWIKGLEYAASGVPFVAQEMPEYVALRKRGVGLTARRYADWQRLLTKLVTDQAFRCEQRQQNLDAVRALDGGEHGGVWLDAYRSLLP